MVSAWVRFDGWVANDAKQGSPQVDLGKAPDNAEWQEQWPPLNATSGTDGANTTELIGIEIVLDLKDWGEIRRLYAMN